MFVDSLVSESSQRFGDNSVATALAVDGMSCMSPNAPARETYDRI